jgi:hypothetical protein
MIHASFYTTYYSRFLILEYVDGMSNFRGSWYPTHEYKTNTLLLVVVVVIPFIAWHLMPLASLVFDPKWLILIMTVCLSACVEEM